MKDNDEDQEAIKRFLNANLKKTNEIKIRIERQAEDYFRFNIKYGNSMGFNFGGNCANKILEIIKTTMNELGIDNDSFIRSQIRKEIKDEMGLITDWLNEKRITKLSSSEKALFQFLRDVSFDEYFAEILKSTFHNLWKRLLSEALKYQNDCRVMTESHRKT